jgi:hypothetical protein
MNGQQTNADGTATEQAGAGTATVEAGQQNGVPTGGAQAAASSQNGGGNQSGNNATPVQSQSGQMVPLSVVTELRQKNRILEAQIGEQRGINEQILREMQSFRVGQQNGVAADNEEGVAPQDKPILDALERRMLKHFGPVLEASQRTSALLQEQDAAARTQRAQAIRQQIAEKNPIFKHPLLGRSAMAELQDELARYEAAGVRVNAFEIASEIAMRLNAVKQDYDASVAQGLVQGARIAQPGTGAGAAVTQGGASGPTTANPLPPPRNVQEATQRYRDEKLRQMRVAAGQA